MLFGRYQISCELETEGFLPSFKGSTFRGAFGAALKRAVCAARQSECKACLLSSRCLYAQTFERQSPSTSLRQAAPPHPYVIEPLDDLSTRYAPNAPFAFDLLLFGEASSYLPYFVYAFQLMGERGIGQYTGRGAGRFRLTGVTNAGVELFDAAANKLAPFQPTQIPWPTLAEDDNTVGEVTLQLVTPLRLKSNNQFSAQLPFSLLTRAALRRISGLFATYGGGEPPLDYRGLTHRASAVQTVNASLKWSEMERYSNRQHEAMLFGGMTGSVTYRGALAPYRPLLELACDWHLGKQTTFGLGKIACIWSPLG
jgi:hypothetical protein